MFLIKFCKKKVLEEDEADSKKFDKYFKHRRDQLLKDNPQGSSPLLFTYQFLEKDKLKEHTDKLKELKEQKKKEDDVKAKAEKAKMEGMTEKEKEAYELKKEKEEESKDKEDQRNLTETERKIRSQKHVIQDIEKATDEKLKIPLKVKWDKLKAREKDDQLADDKEEEEGFKRFWIRHYLERKAADKGNIGF